MSENNLEIKKTQPEVELPDYLKDGLDTININLDASSEDVSINPPLKPKVKEENGKKIITLPKGALVDFYVKKTTTPDSKGYFKGIQKAHLYVVFKGRKSTKDEVEAQSRFEIGSSIQSSGGTPEEVKQRDNIILNLKRRISNLYSCFGNIEDLKGCEIRGKNAATVFVKEQAAKGIKVPEAEYVNEIYYNTFLEFEKVFKPERKPIFFKNEDGEDEFGNPKSYIWLTVHVTVYNNNYQLSFPPCFERYNPKVPAAITADESKYSYEKSAIPKQQGLAKGSITNSSSIGNTGFTPEDVSGHINIDDDAF